MSPLVSIIIPLFNSEQFIKETLESVINQTYENWECIIVDDESSDKSKEIVLKFEIEDSRIKLFNRNRLPKGVSVCRNIGIEESKGKFVIFLDSDDLFSPGCIEERVKYFQSNPDLDFAIFQMETFGSIKVKTTKFKHDYLKSFLECDLPWTVTAPIWRRSFFNKIGGFNEQLNYLEDPEMHIRALLATSNYKVLFNSEPDSFYRQWKKKINDKNNTYYLKLNSYQTFIKCISPQLTIKQKKKLKHYAYVLFIELIYPLDIKEIQIINKLIKISWEFQLVNLFQYSYLKFMKSTLQINQSMTFQKYIVNSLVFLYWPKRFYIEHFRSKLSIWKKELISILKT